MPDPAISAAVATLLVFASGCAALVFQMTWMRELRLTFGATTAAVSAVLAIFMAGLGVGSATLGRVAESTPRPLRLYGLFEIGISIAAAISPALLWLADQLYLSLGGQLALGVYGATAVRLLLATLVMGTPAFLMGGTLPAIVRSATRADDRQRTRLALLYGANTLGAVVGVVVSTFYLLEHLGTRATLWSGCSLSLVSGLIAYRLGSDRRAAAQEEQQVVEEGAPPVEGASLVYLSAAVVGFMFFALEMVWYRILAPIMGGTTFTFGTILAVALLGIGLGGLAYNVVCRGWVRPTLGVLAISCGLEAAVALAPYAAGDRVAVLAAWLFQNADSFAELAGGWLAVTAIVVLPASLVSGVQFPLLIALLGEGREGVGRQVGTAYAWNTFGAIAGSLVAGFGALPLLSAPGMWVAIAIALSALSLALLVAARGAAAPTRLAVVLLVVATGWCAAQRGPTAGWRHSGVGAGRGSFPSFEPNAVEYLLVENRRALAWEADGLEASIGIRDFDGYEFVVNGKVDGNSLSDAPTQVGVALLGAVLHEDPKTAMVIGLGTGESVGWLAEMRGIERVDAVELEPAIDKMVDFCAPVNFDALRHPKVRRIYNDGRETVLTADDHYDIIISEPSNPYRAGVATLYTREFYQAASRRLNEGGVFVQFLQAYEIDNPTVVNVLATVRSAFEHVEVWQTLPVDMQLVCSNQPIEYTAADLRERIADPTVRDAIERVWRTSGELGFLSHFVANADWVDHVRGMPDVTINTDDRTVLEYRFAKTVGKPTGFSVEGARAMLAQEGWHRPPLAGEPVDWQRVELLRQINNFTHRGVLSEALLARRQDAAIVRALAAYRQGDIAGAVASWPPEYADPEDAMLRLVRGHCLAEAGDSGCLELVAPLAKSHMSDVLAVRTIYYWRVGDAGAAEEAFRGLIETLRTDPWGWPDLHKMAFDRSIDLSKQGPEAALRIYQLLERPLAVHRLEYIRRVTRVLVALETGDPEVVADAFDQLEPNAPWTERFLIERAEAYGATNHPAAATARADLERFESQARGAPGG